MDACPGSIQYVLLGACIQSCFLGMVIYSQLLVALSKTVFINRSSREKSMAAFSSAAETMHSHQQSVFIFPEGTRSYYDHPAMLPFKKGAFHLAIQAQVPIVPVVVANYSNVLDVGRRVFTGGRIPTTVLAPVHTKGMTKDDVDSLIQTVRSRMEKELVRISEHAVKQGIAMPSKTKQVAEVHGKSTGADTRGSR